MKRSHRVISFTEDEYKFITLNVSKLVERRRKYPEDFSNELGTSLDVVHRHMIEEGSRSFKMRRPERRILQIFFDKAKKGLETQVIPGYTKRMVTKEDQKKYKPYVERAEAKLALIDSILRKLEEGI